MTKDEMDDLDEHKGTARVVETWLDEGVQRLPEGETLPENVLRQVVSDVEVTPQESGALGWLTKLGLRPGSDGRRASRPRQVFAATTAVIVLAVVGLSVLAVVQEEPGELAGHYLVTPEGGGGFTSIEAAVQEAAAGEVILVRPGVYTEAFVIDKPIIVMGDGPVDDIIVRAPTDGPTFVASLERVPDPASFAITIRDADVSVSGLTFEGPRARLFVDGAAATLSGLVFHSAEELDRAGGWNRGVGSLVIDGGATSTLRDSRFVGGAWAQVFGDADPIIERNLFGERSALRGDFGDSVIVRDNTFEGNGGSAIGFLGGTRGTFSRNEISGFAVGIGQDGSWDGTDLTPVIVDNVLRGNTVGIVMPANSGGEVRDNRFDSNDVAISLVSSDVLLIENELTDNGTGIRINGSEGGRPRLDGNIVTDGLVGLEFQETWEADLVGNTVCDNETNVALTFDARMPDVTGNDVCPDTSDTTP